MKKFSRVLLGILVMFLFTGAVNAYSGSIKATTNVKTAVVGSEFTVTVTVSSSSSLGSWKFGVSYDSSYISYVGGADLSVADAGNGSKKTETYSYRFKAIKSGSAGIRISGASMIAWDDSTYTAFTPTVSNATVSVKTQAEIQASYSKDNYLKSLSVEGYEISPAFDKDTLEYMVSVPDTETQITLNAAVNDSKSRVTGTGTVDISEGTNKFDIVVTAENGSTRTYTLNVDVKDLNPISVTVDSKNYTVVKKDSLLTEPTGFTPTVIQIENSEIPAFKSELLGFTVVGLKDDAGKVGMFIYDEGANSYKEYYDLKGTSLTLYPLSIESVPEGFVKDKITINGVEVEILKGENIDNFYLIYAQNIENGEKHYYQFDPDTNGFIRYNDAYQKVSQQNREYTLYLIALGVITAVFFLLVIILSSKISKLKKLLRKMNQAKMEDKESSIEKVEVKESPVEERKEDFEENIDKESQEEDYVNILEEDNKRKKKRRKR